MKPATQIAFVLLLLVAAAHVLRMVYRVEITAGGVDIPQGLSLLGVVIFGATALFLWKQERR